MSEQPPHEPSSNLPNASRRDFLTRTAAIAGAGALLGAGVAKAASAPVPRAKARAPLAPGAPLRIGVIGVGGMGGEHCNSLARLAKDGRESFEVVAVADICAARAASKREDLAKLQGIEVQAYANHREMLAREDIHGVLIATPEHWHAQMVEDAVAQGKDAYVEKPMTLRLPEALRLRDLSIANPDAIVQVGTQFMTHEKYHVARRMIAEGAIGKPVFSQTSYCRNSKDGEWLYYGIDPNWKPGENLDWKEWCGPLGMQPWDPAVYARWRRYRKYSTGIIGDLLVHVATPLVMALDQGWPTRVVASGGHYVDHAMENHDQVNIQVEFERGHTMVLAGSTCNEQGLETMIRGHRATLYMAGKDVRVTPERHWVDEIEPETIVCAQNADQDELRLDWIRCMRTREQNVSTIDFATQVMVIVDLATRSMWEGKAFEFDPTRMEARPI